MLLTGEGAAITTATLDAQTRRTRYAVYRISGPFFPKAHNAKHGVEGSLVSLPQPALMSAVRPYAVAAGSTSWSVVP